MYFTEREMTLRRHPKSLALKQAEAVLETKGVQGTCTNALARFDELLTTQELSELIQEIVWDSTARG